MAKFGHHTLSGTMENALGSNLCTHGRGDQSDSDSLFRWSLKLRFFVRTFPPPAVTASRAQAKTCLVEVVRPCPVQAPLIEAIFMMKRLVSTTLSGKVHTLGPLRCAAALKLESMLTRKARTHSRDNFTFKHASGLSASQPQPR